MTRKLPAIVASLAVLAAFAVPAMAKDNLILGMVLEPPVLDPTAGAAQAIREVSHYNIFEGLTRVDRDGTVKPLLAESWTVSADGLVYKFSLHRNVKFHDGTPFDCSIVKYSYERAAAPDSTNAQKGYFEPIASTECPDPNTAVVTLKRPSALFLFEMGIGDAAMVAPKSAATNKTDPVGTGPFKFARWVKGDHVDLVRNEEYWGNKAALKTVTFKFVSDPSAAAAAIMAGDIDAFPLFPAPETLPQFKADPRFTVEIGLTEGKTIMSLNDTRKPFDDVRVRRALAYAVDRKAIIDGANSGLGTPIGSHFAPQDPGYVDLTGMYPHDPAKAKALLAEAGHASGLELTLTMPPPTYARRAGEIIAAELAEVGVKVNLVPVEWAQWLDKVFKTSDFDMTIISHVEPHDLDIYAREKYYFNYHSPEFNALYKKYLETVDTKAQLDLLGQMQRKLAEDEPNIFLYILPKIGVWNAKLKGMWKDAPIFANVLSEVSWAE